MSWTSDKNWVIGIAEATHREKGTLRNKGLDERSRDIQVEVNLKKWFYLVGKKKIANKGNRRQVKRVEEGEPGMSSGWRTGAGSRESERECHEASSLHWSYVLWIEDMCIQGMVEPTLLF